MERDKTEKDRTFHAVEKDLFNDQEKVSVLLVGCGGTGSHILTRLAILDHALRKMGFLGLEVMVVDDDIVEEKNVGRQMFTIPDIGDFKARVAVSKVNMAFGLAWGCTLKKLDRENVVKGNILITAMDNMEGRILARDLFRDPSTDGDHINHKKMYWIDCGNGRDFGQVVLCDAKGTLHDVFEIMPWIMEDQYKLEAQGPGCSYADSLLEQGLFINNDMAHIAVSMLERMFMDRVMYYNAVFSNLRTMDRNSSLWLSK